LPNRNGQTGDVSTTPFDPRGRLVSNDSGQVAFRALIQSPLYSVYYPAAAIIAGSQGSLRLVASQDAPAPGAAGRRFGEIDNPALNNLGQTAFVASLSGGAFDSGIWSEGGGSLQLVARSGDPTPGATGLVFAPFDSEFHPAIPVLNDAGQMAFSAEMYNAEGAHGGGIWRGRAGQLDLVVRDGMTAPGTEGASFGFFENPVLNGAGHTAFVARLQQANSVGPENNQGIWSDGHGALTLIARSGSLAPGCDGAVFDDLVQPAMNEAGRVAFVGFTRTSVGDMSIAGGIWSEGFDALNLVARSGQPAPDSKGATFARFDSPTINSAGQVAFAAALDSVDPMSGLQSVGIWAQDAIGVLRGVVLSGDAIEVSPGDLRTVSFVGFAADQLGMLGDGRESRQRQAFNDYGQIAFWAYFTDGSQGVFVRTVPEPSTWMLGLLGAAVLAVIFYGHRAAQAA
jgi:hypothetical protein